MFLWQDDGLIADDLGNQRNQLPPIHVPGPAELRHASRKLPSEFRLCLVVSRSVLLLSSAQRRPLIAMTSGDVSGDAKK